jgi:hypothetical protein
VSHVPPQFQAGLPPPPPDPADATATAAAPVQLEAHEQSGRDRWPAWLSIAGFAAGYGTTIVLGLIVLAARWLPSTPASDEPEGGPHAMPEAACNVG